MANGTSNYVISNTFAAAAGKATGPYLIPPNFPDSGDLQIWITAVTTALATANTPGVTSTAPLPTQPDFTLAFATATMPTVPGIYVKVTVKSSNLYSDQRGALQASFTKFQQQVEQLEFSGLLIPGGAQLLLSRVVASLPLRFDEILFYYYGFSANNQCLDLQPGMNLRVEWGAYQYCNPVNGPGNSLNAFTGAGISRWQLVQRPDATLAFDAFLAGFNPSYTLNPQASCPLAAGSLLDTQVSGNTRRHWRLIYPRVFNGAQTLNSAGANTQYSAILLGADTFADIALATNAVLAGTSACNKQTNGNKPIISIVFTGRTIVVPEISVLLRNAPTWLPVGASVRTVIQQIADPAPLQVFNGNAGIQVQPNPTMWRWMQSSGPVLSTISNPYAPTTVTFTNSSNPNSAAGPYGDLWDLPLIKGDFLNWYEPLNAPQ